MKQFRKSVVILLAGLYLIIIAGLCWPLKNTYGCYEYYYVDISTCPANGFLKADNIAPGDVINSILRVMNNGNLDFNYTVSSYLESGETALFNELLLQVSDSEGLLYQGTLREFQDFPLGTISKGRCNDLNFSVTLPKDAGNELQGKSISVAFNFNAIAHDDDIPLGDVCFEPPFSNSRFALHQKSTVPIKFHLRDAEGNLENSPQKNIRLEITGPAADGRSADYVFSVNDGTLKFDTSVHEPHYMARFSTFDYPVVTGCTYTATVYYGSQVLCERVFQVETQGNRSHAP